LFFPSRRQIGHKSGVIGPRIWRSVDGFALGLRGPFPPAEERMAKQRPKVEKSDLSTRSLIFLAGRIASRRREPNWCAVRAPLDSRGTPQRPEIAINSPRIKSGARFMSALDGKISKRSFATPHRENQGRALAASNPPFHMACQRFQMRRTAANHAQDIDIRMPRVKLFVAADRRGSPPSTCRGSGLQLLH